MLALVRAARLRAAGLRGDNSDAPFIMRAMSLHFRKRGGVHFFGARPRPKGTSAEMWGPSQRISKIRECIIADHDGHNPCHPWMSHASRMDAHVCKRVRRPAFGLHYLPDDLPDDVWEAVGAYMENFALGTEEILKPTNGLAAGC